MANIYDQKFKDRLSMHMMACDPVSADLLFQLRYFLWKAEQERDELAAWKESAMRVMPPFQEIGAELGLKVGEEVHDKILPGIRELKKRLAENLPA